MSAGEAPPPMPQGPVGAVPAPAGTPLPRPARHASGAAVGRAAAPTHSERVGCLLARMTLEEKAGQMTQLAIGALAAEPGGAGGPRLDAGRLREAVVERGVGSILNYLDGPLPPDGWRALVGRIQELASATRLGIPVLYGIDAVHGANYTVGGTIFPHNLGMAATFDRALVRRAAEVTRDELIASGLPWNFAPVVDVGRQPLWPRFYETYGEDPLVAAELGREALRGLQRGGGVAACLKHFLAYGGPQSGRDRTPSTLSRRAVRELFLPPFRAGVEAGVLSVMVNSGEIDGEPVHASRYWLTDVLRDELGFRGVVVTDWEDVRFLHTRHRVAASIKDAVRLAVEAGIDMSMTPFDFGFADHLVELVREGDIAECRIDRSVARILTLKEAVGLLDAAVPDANGAAVGTPAARRLALRAARESIVLLRNEPATRAADGRRILPLRRGARLLVTGPAAASVTALHGGWTWTWQGDDAARYPGGEPTLLDALRDRAASVEHVAGAGFREPLDIAHAAEAARAADVAVVALGEDAYAEWLGDLDDLHLPAAQLRLAEAVLDTGTPTVVVLLQGRPRLLGSLAERAHAVLFAGWPGAGGARAIAEVLFGEVNPAGRLPFTYPRRPNALIAYDHRHTETLNAELVRGPGGFDPQWELGHGLGYAEFRYSDLRIDRAVLGFGDRLEVEVTVTNAGEREGSEAVLLFTRQHFAALTPPVRRLRDFEKVALGAGEARRVRFAVPVAELAYVGTDGAAVLEPGAYDVMVGGLSLTFELLA